MKEQIADRIDRDPWHLRPHRQSKSGLHVSASHSYFYFVLTSFSYFMETVETDFDPLPSLSLNYKMKAIAVRECGSVVSIHFRLGMLIYVSSSLDCASACIPISNSIFTILFFI